MLSRSRVVSHSTFLLLLTFALRLIISSFNLLLSDAAWESFSFNTVTLWEVACDKVVEAISTITKSSSVFSNKTSSSWISYKVPSFCFSLRNLFRLTSFLKRLKVKSSRFLWYCNSKDLLLLGLSNAFQTDFSPWLENYEILHVFQEFELRSKWEIDGMLLLIFLDKNQYYAWTLKKRKMIPPHPLF